MSKRADYYKRLIRDSSIYYSSIIVPIAAYTILFGVFFINNDTASLHSGTGIFWFVLKLIWLTNIMLSTTNLIGILLYGSPYKTDLKNIQMLKHTGWNPKKQLRITYVSRGDNGQALKRSISQTLAVLQSHNVNYTLEAVTDIPVWSKLEKDPKLSVHVVPEAYKTRKGAKYKARALHYVIEQRGVTQYASTKNTWVLHLDEESVITKSTLAGIHKFIHNRSNQHSIGQGEIKYNAYQYGSRLFITAIDSIRTGDDLGRFRFQYKFLKKPVFGMHGSYFLVPLSIEKYIGFDLGGRGSITEDAYFALHAMEKGVAFQWIDGYIREQSPFSVGAVLKQRRRWFCGLKYLAFDEHLRLPTRIILLLNTMLWTLGWLGPVITIINLFFNRGYAPTILVLIAAVSQGAYTGAYLIGSYRNLLDLKLRSYKKLMLYITTFIFIPLSGIIEGLAILYAIIRPVKTFDVVKK